MKTKTKINNRLWQARNKLGLEQKQVARLLGHKSCDQISRYERGVRMPSLRIALKLELIYGTPVSSLFPDHYQKFRAEIAVNLSGGNSFKNSSSPEDENAIEYLPEAHVCTYAVSLLQKKPTASEIDAVRRHTIKLTHQLGDIISRYKPPE